MIESKLQKKYEFFEYNSELIIPKENFKISNETKILKDNSNLILEPKQLDIKNKLVIENSTFIIKVPDKNQILIIFSIDKDLPSKIEKNTYSIPFDHPVLQAISFMNDSQNESIIISTGNENNFDDIQVFQIQIKQLLHEALYTLLKDIKNAIKIVPVKDSFVLILHNSTEIYKNGGLKLWKNLKEEIYNFNIIYNFSYNYQNNKIICIDNKEAPFTFSIYTFDESYFNKKSSDRLQPEFFIQLGEYLKLNKEEDIENFLHFESFFNIIIFLAKTKDEKIGYLFGIFFANFKEKKILDYLEFNFDANGNYFLKVNKNTNEIYIFNLKSELLFIYSFKTENKNELFLPENLFLSKTKFSGNIKGIDFTANNGMVVLTEQNNLICYSRNENIFQNNLKKFKEQNSKIKSDIENNKKSKSANNEGLKIYSNNFYDSIKDMSYENNNLKLKKFKSDQHLNNKNFIKDKNNNDNSKENIKENNKQNDLNNLNNKINNKEGDIKEIIKENDIDLNIELKKKNEQEEAKKLEIMNKQTELLEKLKSKMKEKTIIYKLSNSFQNKLSKFEETILSGISKLKLEEIYNQIESIKQNNISSYENFDIDLAKVKNFIYDIISILPDLNYTKNKFILFIQNEIKRKESIKQKNDNNLDFESPELMNKVINKELSEKPKLKKDIEKILYNSSKIDRQLNIVSEINGDIKIIETKLNLLLLKCQNDINQINEMYKYTKFKISKKEEYKFIHVLINPFIEFYHKIVKELELKINSFIKNVEEKDVEKENNLMNKINFIYENDNIENRLSFQFLDIFKKNNFYSLNEPIIKNNYINLDNEFE